ncbi:MAG TPA: ABC transporter permease [Acidimicrobiia bacterium]|nr:ABC transporter permease [Acidimicrobiia bacterium]
MAAISHAPVMRVLEREWVVWRRLWRGSTFSYVVAPLLFLAAMGLGLGDLVQKGSGDVAGVSYLDFVTPGLMAASAVMMAAGDSLWPVMAGVKWMGTYHAAVSTPIESADVYVGKLVWTGARTVMSATIFLIVAAVLGGVPSIWGVLAIPATVLGALAISAPMVAWAVTQESDGPFAVVMRIVVFPLFLFSGTFFPVSRLPDSIEWIAFLSPLWHAVELCRGATTGGETGANTLGAVVVHVVVLAVWIAVGAYYGVRTFRRVLTQ